VPAGVRPMRPQPLPRAGLPGRTGHGRRSRGRRAAPPTVLAAFLATLLATGLAGCGDPPGPNVITVSAARCGAGWRQVTAGPQTFQLHNPGARAAGADLIDPATGAVYAAVTVIGPGTTRPMPVDLGSGRYVFRCLIQPGGSHTGPVVRIGGHRRGSAAVAPVTAAELAGPSAAYHRDVQDGLATLAGQVAALDADIHAGRLAAARSAWLSAHLSWARLDGAYPAFGNYVAQIEAVPGGLPGGVTDPAFTGFYRLEYGLWRGQNASALAGPAAALGRAVQALRTFWPSMQLPSPGLVQGLLQAQENTVQFQLSGADDFGSGTTLATAAAGVTGVAQALAVLRPVLAPRDPGLAAATGDLGRLADLLAAADRDGTWTPVSHLDTPQRQGINAAAGVVLEDLASAAAVAELRRP
jgi:iron uptake system component EfeO